MCYKLIIILRIIELFYLHNKYAKTALLNSYYEYNIHFCNLLTRHVLLIN